MDLTLDAWTAETDGEFCVNVRIHESINLEGATIKLINGERQVMIHEKLESHDLKMCSETDKPLYVEIHVPGFLPSVRYVEHSGRATYSSSVSR
jgi:hypothetical protein